ncbi:ribonuclease Z [Picrophilus oshimae]|uniref:Ribonuclease Z n=1 Tax=Picrophilus torridus (strain ATCC 700027 / DSM 9790 / JCM 10055 / NBRC 100828 / KAW 2/3) TaxID=1122961 RepID=RNZ_PICTO|nr:ribonuclease Z [Picrophilus oshimae]Q6KZJ4.1 RecName: Full=Ribonuclease Z; Short=RNase Z; AltName: Full=tRNA 3 endonuclease; AltName: Full=tRNase Z [Picrophilus oshimae DSM 9789]AAT43858.1 metallo-beta-lactamase [Picrophilus oshimae DSM 9789]
MASTFKITFLGTGGSVPKPGRGLPAIAVQVDNIVNLFDCGEGTQKQFMKSGVSFMNVKNIFISHFHGDHFFGLPGLLSTFSFNGRIDDLNIFGPPGTIDEIKKVLSLIDFKITYNIKIAEMEENKKYDFDLFDVYAIKNDHTKYGYSYKLKEKDLIKINREKADSIGFPKNKLELLRNNGEYYYMGKRYSIWDVADGIKPGRSIVYSGDTRPFNDMLKFASNCDVLIHDSTMDASIENLANEYGHSTARQAAEIALKANVKRLFLFHYSSRYNDLNLLLNEAKSIFNDSYLSREMLEFNVDKKTELIKI